MPLDDLNNFITTNHHLPQIPSAKFTQQNGLSLGNNQTKLLQKIEELTLYVIDQNKKEESDQYKIGN